MTRKGGAVHIARVVRKYHTRDGASRESVSYLLRRSYREGGKIRHETLGNVSALPPSTLDALRASLSGKTLVVAGEDFKITRSLPHGHLAAVATMAKTLGLRDLLGPACKERDIAYALILARVVHPRPKLATTKWWADTTLVSDLGLEDVGTDEVYAAMDWLVKRQGVIETSLARRHLGKKANPSELAYFDLSSSWVEGTHNELAFRGYSRDKKRGTAQIEYGLLTDKDGRPVAIQVFPGNTADPTAFVSIVDTIRTRFGLDRLTMVGDRGMITSARITALREAKDIGWLTCLRAPQIAALAMQDGPLQLSLFDERDLAEFIHPDYPGERLVACRNPLLAEERRHKREKLLAATEAVLAPVITAVDEGRLVGAGKIGLRLGKVINKYKMAKHFKVSVTDTTLAVTRKEDFINQEAALDGIYVLRTTLTDKQLDGPGVVSAYKDLSRVERDFRHIKVDDIDLRPIHHRLEARVRAHVFICMLAAYVVWHLRKTLAPLTFTDETPPVRTNPVAPAIASPGARTKAARKRNANGDDVLGFRELLDHLGTLTRNTMKVTSETTSEFEILATPTPLQRRVFELLGAQVTLRLM
ncbi:MAG: IS1634 family transposase [Actinobacteria bacterium]|nr:IS1634 family transposase [Actinomycetota bacterium]MCL6105029.1 IS1634 family transposase [Actinomycetota bacterium]